MYKPLRDIGLPLKSESLLTDTGIRKPNVNVVFLGHVDCGKSTAIGRLLHKLVPVSDETLAKVQSVAMSLSKRSYKYALLTDSSRLEVERGITMTNHYSAIQTEDGIYTLVSIAGHRDFVRTALRGVCDGHVSVLVVSARIGQFEASMKHTTNYGCTVSVMLSTWLSLNNAIDSKTEHSSVESKASGSAAPYKYPLIVAVNKFDCIDSDSTAKTRFDEICAEIRTLMRELGFSTAQIEATPFLPISAWTAQNVFADAPSFDWYSGRNLWQAIVDVSDAVLRRHKQLREKCEAKRDSSNGWLQISGRSFWDGNTRIFGVVRGGALECGSTVFVNSERRRIQSMQMHFVPLSVAFSGDFVSIQFDRRFEFGKHKLCGRIVSATQPESVSKGLFGAHVSAPPWRRGLRWTIRCLPCVALAPAFIRQQFSAVGSASMTDSRLKLVCGFVRESTVCVPMPLTMLIAAFAVTKVSAAGSGRKVSSLLVFVGSLSLQCQVLAVDYAHSDERVGKIGFDATTVTMKEILENGGDLRLQLSPTDDCVEFYKPFPAATFPMTVSTGSCGNFGHVWFYGNGF